MGEIDSGKHSFFSRGRDGTTVEGVLDAVSFDERGVALETICGSMAIEGEGLRVTVLDIAGGKVAVEGRIVGVYYFDSRPVAKKGLFGRRDGAV